MVFLFYFFAELGMSYYDTHTWHVAKNPAFLQVDWLKRVIQPLKPVWIRIWLHSQNKSKWWHKIKNLPFRFSCQTYKTNFTIWLESINQSLLVAPLIFPLINWDPFLLNFTAHQHLKSANDNNYCKDLSVIQSWDIYMSFAKKNQTEDYRSNIKWAEILEDLL